MFFNKTVLPVLGCATIIPRCPLPIGENKSRIRVERLLGLVLNFNFSFGKRGVRYSNETRSRISSVVFPLTVSTLRRAKYFSPSFGGRIRPFTVSPVFKPNNLI